MLVVDSTSFKRLHFHKYTILTSDYRDLTDFFVKMFSMVTFCQTFLTLYNVEYMQITTTFIKASPKVKKGHQGSIAAKVSITCTNVHILVLGSWNIIMVMVTRCWGSITIRQQYVLWLDILLLVVPLSVFLDGRFLFILPYTYISL